MRPLLFTPQKRDYVRGKRPNVPCIFCAVRDRHPEVARLVLDEDERVLASYNLYPYNPGHVILFPRRHVECLSDLTRAEVRAMHDWTLRIVELLDAEYDPSGYNVGYNLGRPAGASIEHLHLHIVPRYLNEVGFIDVIGGARVYVEDPRRALSRLRRRLRARRRDPRRRPRRRRRAGANGGAGARRKRRRR